MADDDGEPVDPTGGSPFGPFSGGPPRIGGGERKLTLVRPTLPADDPDEPKDAEVVELEHRRTLDMCRPMGEHEKRACEHVRTRMDVRAGVLSCKDCDRQLSPFSVLLRFVRDWDRTTRAVDWAKSERKRIEDEIERLKGEKKKLQAAVRYLREQQGKLL